VVSIAAPAAVPPAPAPAPAPAAAAAPDSPFAAPAVPASPRSESFRLVGPRPGAGAAKTASVGLDACRRNELLVLSPHVNPIALHQYRKVASTLHQLQVERGLRSLVVTSAVAGEGKTLTATNLALTLSESFHRRVLLIDADLRRPSVAGLFKANVPQGLTDALAEDGGSVVPLVAVSEHLSILTGGKADPDPASKVTSTRLKDLIAAAVESFDWVIVDTPPVNLFSDASLMSMLVDGVVLVVRASNTSSMQAQRAIAAITPERIVGAILNQTEDVAMREHGYGDTEYTEYHSSSDTATVDAIRS
jgi:capsular exopolysaccharide synthesis family protein